MSGSTHDAMVTAAARLAVFDGWGEATFAAAARDAGLDIAAARRLFPRGPIDLAQAFHLRGDAALAAHLEKTDLSALRYSQRVAHAVMARLEIAALDREAVRRAAAFFALPIHAATGSRCIWNTADTIWTALGDNSRDANWYTKRMILSGVYSAALLYWLGDDSPDTEKTRAFVDRRIAGVMAFEKAKARIKDTRAYQAFRAGPGRIFDSIRAPGAAPPADLPGFWPPRE